MQTGALHRSHRTKIERKEINMLGNFGYCNPTRLYFGDNSLKYLNRELKKYGPNILLTYGGGSIKKNGIYDEIIQILEMNDKTVFELPGVMANPTVHKLYEGCELAREHEAVQRKQ